MKFLSTLSLRRATYQSGWPQKTRTISIHALLAESDSILLHAEMNRNNFYPRSPCGERPERLVLRVRVVDISIHALLAESDASCFGADGSVRKFLSTLSLRRATLFDGVLNSTFTISIHALLAESDCPALDRSHLPAVFLSTLSLRRATYDSRQRKGRHRYFYPRSPCGERQGGIRLPYVYKVFLSTLSLRRATWICRPFFPCA